MYRSESPPVRRARQSTPQQRVSEQRRGGETGIKGGYRDVETKRLWDGRPNCALPLFPFWRREPRGGIRILKYLDFHLHDVFRAGTRAGIDVTSCLELIVRYRMRVAAVDRYCPVPIQLIVIIRVETRRMTRIQGFHFLIHGDDRIIFHTISAIARSVGPLPRLLICLCSRLIMHLQREKCYSPVLTKLRWPLGEIYCQYTAPRQGTVLT